MTRRSSSSLPAADSAWGVLILGLLLAGLGYGLPIDMRWLTVPLAFFVPGNAVVSALFGRHLEFGGVRRAGLCAVMSLVAYAIVGLAVFGLGFRMSHLSVVVSVAGLSALCAAVIAVRSHRWPAFRVARHEEYRRRISAREVVAPLVAMAASLIVAYTSVQILPRRPPDEYTAIAFDGTWALTNRIVRVDAARDVQVQYRVMNRTRIEQVFGSHRASCTATGGVDASSRSACPLLPRHRGRLLGEGWPDRPISSGDREDRLGLFCDVVPFCS